MMIYENIKWPKTISENLWTYDIIIATEALNKNQVYKIACTEHQYKRFQSPKK